MTKPLIYYWPAINASGFINDIATAQDVVLGDQVVLIVNTPSVPPSFSYVPDDAFPDVTATITPAPAPGVFSYVNVLTPNTTMNGLSTDLIRSISISSPLDFIDNSDVTFLIQGIGTPVDLNGNPTQVIGPISEVLNGPGAGQVATSANIYTVINSITNIVNPTTQIGNDADDIIVGFGPNGITNYYRADTNRNVTSIDGLSYSIQIINQVTMDLDVYISLNTPEVPAIYGGLDSFGIINGQPVAFIPAFLVGAGITTNTINSIPVPAIIWIQVNTTSSDSMFFTVIQQGI